MGSGPRDGALAVSRLKQDLCFKALSWPRLGIIRPVLVAILGPRSSLADALAELRQRGARISWFHPTHKAAISAALQGGKKYIDRFVPLANLADLQAARPLLR